MKRVFAALLALGILIPATLLPFFDPVDGSTIARRIRYLSSAPGACQADRGEVYFNTTDDKIYRCTAANTWTEVGGGTAIADGDKGDITVSGSGATWTIDNNVVSYAKMQDVSAASKLLGRGDSGSGDPQEITIGTGLTMTGTTLSASGGGGSVTANSTVGRFPYLSATDVYSDSPAMRIASDTTALINTTNSQIFDIYKTSSSNTTPADYNRLRFHTSGGDTFMVTQAAGSGSTTQKLILGTDNNGEFNFRTNGTNRAFFDQSGHFRPVADNTYDLGNSNTTRWRNVYTYGLVLESVNVLRTAGGTITMSACCGLTSLFEFQNVSVDQLKVDDGGTKPTCNSTNRGIIWHDYGGAGVKDTVEVCAKDAGDSYAWRTIY